MEIHRTMSGRIVHISADPIRVCISDVQDNREDGADAGSDDRQIEAKAINIIASYLVR